MVFFLSPIIGQYRFKSKSYVVCFTIKGTWTTLNVTLECAWMHHQRYSKDINVFHDLRQGYGLAFEDSFTPKFNTYYSQVKHYCKQNHSQFWQTVNTFCSGGIPIGVFQNNISLERFSKGTIKMCWCCLFFVVDQEMLLGVERFNNDMINMPWCCVLCVDT